MTEEISLDNIIERLWSSRSNPKIKKVLKKREISYLCNQVRPILISQPVFLELIPPLTICGDIHGQFFDLLRTFEAGGSPELTNYLFLGDYVDRGEYSISVICLLFAYKIKYPNNFFLLRGNHESALINKEYGFYDECREIYCYSVWREINDVFEWLPISASIDSRILCIHGGISPELKSLDDLRNIKRPTEIPEHGLLSDILWSDPDPRCPEWGESDRGTSFIFGLRPLKALLSDIGFDLIVRAHQAIDSGYDLPFSPDRSMVTIFGAPNYAGEFQNKAAMMHISERMICTFTVLEPLKEKGRPPPGERPATPPIEKK